MKLVQTAERISHAEASDNVIFQRSVFAYHEAAKRLGSSLLEIGTGMGYGMEILAPHVETYTAVDKYTSELVEKNKQNPDFHFLEQSVPPLAGIADESVDSVVSFQVIEHIKKDHLFVEEIARVLKNQGKAIITTPNIKMSLTRNPWHIREYTVHSLRELLQGHFSKVEIFGVYGNEAVNQYYEENKKSVKKYTRFDILNLQYNLPRFVLQIPYDILNRINRKKLLNQSSEEVQSISYSDYHLKEADDFCYDLFAVASK
jgi:ubiquinone/menaquinone biosynthesis C-methylase UbiE